MTSDFTTIRQMCDMFDVTPRTLRFYEEKELIAPVREGQKRQFTSRDRARMTLIVKWRGFGFSLEDIRQLLNLYGNGDGKELQLIEVHKRAQLQLRALHEENAQMDRMISELSCGINDLDVMVKSQSNVTDLRLAA